MLPIGLMLDGHLSCDPGERNIGLRAVKLLQSGGSDIVLSGHAGGRRQHSVRADEIAALPDASARKADCLVVVAPDELGIRGDAVKYRREWIARAQPQRSPRGNTGFFPPAALGQHQTIISLSQRKVRIEPERYFELCQRILEAPRE